MDPSGRVRSAVDDRGLYYYEVAGSDLSSGCSLGNDQVWVNSLVTGALQGFFHVGLGRTVMGSFALRWATNDWGFPGEDRPQGPVPLHPDPDAVFRLHPAYQRLSYGLLEGIRVEETFFLPRGSELDPPLAYVTVLVRNEGRRPRHLRLYGWADFRGAASPEIVGRYEDGCLMAWGKAEPNYVRVLGSTWPVAEHHLTCDEARLYDFGPWRPPDPDGQGPFGGLAVDLELGVGEVQEGAFLLAFSPEGAEKARELVQWGLDYRSRLGETLGFFAQHLQQAVIRTPDAVINEGVQWAKVNLLRVIARYPTGCAFTNEPGVSSHVVGRDVGWFTLGCDYFLPSASREMLLNFAAHQTPEGKLPEYYDARDGRIEDYGLNINNDTPLFILGVHHHYRSTIDRDFLSRVYPVAEKAARYLLSQRDDRGLIISTAGGEEIWGIAGWRNVIPHYTLNGAVTELNSESYAALRAMAKLSGAMDKAEEYNFFMEEAHHLRKAINQHLLNPATGVYLLNIDLDGVPHSDVTGDQVFPVMFRVAPPEVAFRIVSWLNSPDFWTEAGLRTVSRLSPSYRPRESVGLLGGVWPGLSFWYAFAAARYHPEFMTRSLHASYYQYIREPRRNNTVPGQYAEWFDGETLTNQGLRLSPWEAPRYLWAAVEGLAGVDTEGQILRVAPRVPANWTWLIVRGLQVQGRTVTYFLARQADGLHLYASHPFTSELPLEVVGEDVTVKVESFAPETEVLALAGEEGLLLGLGNTRSSAVAAALDLSALLHRERRYRVSVYDSERKDWQELGRSLGQSLATLAARIEPSGFRLYRIVPE